MSWGFVRPSAAHILRGMTDLDDLNPEATGLPEELPESPMPLVRLWYSEAERLKLQPNPNAMSLATIDPDGSPSVRIVLCKGIDVEGGSFVFFTNYQSRKGRAIESSPRAAGCLHWDDLELQIRFAGPVVKVTPEESDAYFASRSLISRVGAAASDQSRPIDSHESLIEQVAERATELGVGLADLWSGAQDIEVPRPSHWGGFRVHASEIELWVGGEGRLHDRAVWRRSIDMDGGAVSAGSWSASRLQP